MSPFVSLTSKKEGFALPRRPVKVEPQEGAFAQSNDFWLQAGLSRIWGARLRHWGQDGDGRRVVVQGEGQSHRNSHFNRR